MTRRKPLFLSPRRMSLRDAHERLMEVACPRNVGRAVAKVMHDVYGEVPARFLRSMDRPHINTWGFERRFFHSIRQEAVRLEKGR